MSDSRSSPSNNDGLFHSLYLRVKKGILTLTITDCIQKDGLIHLSYNLKLFLRRHNLPAKEVYSLPSKIVDSNFYSLFNNEECQLIMACNAFNAGMNFKSPTKKMSKVIFGEKIFVMIQDISDTKNMLSFEFDEKGFTGLMKKYRTSNEIRKMIKELLTYG